MKKVFLAILAVSLLSVSVFGVEGKIGLIKVDGPEERIIVGVVDENGAMLDSKKLVGTPDIVKAALAVALTAKAMNADVKLVEVAGSGGWSNVIIK